MARRRREGTRGRRPGRRLRRCRPSRPRHPSSGSARVQSDRTAAIWWLTNRTVRPPPAASFILPRHFFWNSTSPTASTSSTTSTSGSRCGRDAEGQAYEHAAGVAFDGRVQELLDAAEVNDFVELVVDPLPTHAQDRAVEVDVLSTGELRVKARADFEQTADSAPQVDRAGGGFGDAAEQLEHRALARAVPADQADDFASFDVEDRRL